jgi:hypothetical protein
VISNTHNKKYLTYNKNKIKINLLRGGAPASSGT